MSPITVLCVSLALIASVYGGSYRAPRQAGWGPTPGWSPTPGWGANPTVITEEGASEAIGIGAAIAEHQATVTVVGSPEVPALLSISTGSGVGLNQYVSNYQQTGINADGSSAAYQGNSASNSGYAYEYLGGDAQGLHVDVNTTGWAGTEGEGAVVQVDNLDHQGGNHGSGSGWRKP